MGRPPKKPTSNNELDVKPIGKKDRQRDILDDIIENVFKESKRLSDDKDKYIIKDCFDTGSVVLNMLISGDLYGGVPDNRATQFVGDPGCGKSLISKYCMKDAISKGWRFGYIDTEGDLDAEEFTRFGIDNSRILPINEVETTTDLSMYLTKFLEYVKPESKIGFTIDSIGNLPSQKEVVDAIAGEDKTDMTRAKNLKGFFRKVLKKSFDKRVPLILINHQYETQGYIVQKVEGGGTGSRFGSSIIIEFSKAQWKNSADEVIGYIITAKSKKNRVARVLKSVKLGLRFDGGISRYSGLDGSIKGYDGLIVECGVGKTLKKGNSIVGVIIDGVEYETKKFTDEQWDELIKKHNLNQRIGESFKYKTNAEHLNIDDEISTDEEETINTEEN